MDSQNFRKKHLFVTGGGYISLFPVILPDYIGMKRMPQGFGITVMFMGLTNMGVPTMLGTVSSVSCLTVDVFL